MNKNELVEAVAEASSLSRTEASRAVEAVFSTLTKTLKRGEQVSVAGFGTFAVKRRAARTGRNPRTGEPLQIPAANVPGFKAGKGLRDAVN